MARQRQQRGKTGSRLTFGEILEQTRLVSARHAWDRAKVASLYRKAAIERGCSGVRSLSRIKTNAARRAFELAPEYVTIGLDDDFQVGLPSVRWRGLGRLHLVAATETGRWVSDRAARPHPAVPGARTRTYSRTA